MNEIELSRRLGQLHLRLNKESLNRLITEIRKAKGLESLSEPFKSWLLSPQSIGDEYLTQSARKAREQIELDKRRRAMEKLGTVTPKFSIQDDED